MDSRAGFLPSGKMDSVGQSPKLADFKRKKEFFLK
jgi:hypothetical protein